MGNIIANNNNNIILNGGGGTYINNTIVNNTVQLNFGGNALPVLTNNIIWGNFGRIDLFYGHYSYYAIRRNCLGTLNHQNVTDNIFESPLFVTGLYQPCSKRTLSVRPSAARTLLASMMVWLSTLFDRLKPIRLVVSSSRENSLAVISVQNML